VLQLHRKPRIGLARRRLRHFTGGQTTPRDQYAPVAEALADSGYLRDIAGQSIAQQADDYHQALMHAHDPAPRPTQGAWQVEEVEAVQSASQEE
jgi:hypothetical protein